jgi:two-component system nitrate/nitrite response regulator NarL
MQEIKIGLAEDHQKYRDVLKMILAFTPDLELVVVAANGQELLEKMKTTDVDVIILDNNMPVLNGMDTLKILKQDFPFVKTIVMSSNNEYEIVRKYAQLGANSYLLKNTDYKVLVATIKSVHAFGISPSDMFHEQKIA